MHYLSLAGVEFGSIKMKVKDVLWSMLPDLLNKWHSHIPSPLKNGVKKVASIFFSVISHIVSVLIINPLIKVCGGWNKGSDLPLKTGAMSFSDLPSIKSGSVAWYENVFDKDVEFSSKTVEKQLKTREGSTWVHSYGDCPSMSIVPPISKESQMQDLMYLEDLRRLYGVDPVRKSKTDKSCYIPLPA